MPDMSEETQPTKSAEPTPEQLLKLLDLQIAANRAKRKESPGGRRTTIAMIGILLIILGTGAALLILQQVMADLPSAHPGPVATPPPQKSQ